MSSWPEIFIISAAILIGLGVLNAAFSAEKSFEISHALNFFGARGKEMWLIKLMVLAVNSFSPFSTSHSLFATKHTPVLPSIFPLPMIPRSLMMPLRKF